jgi:membrane-associated protease RseP (regulator of RpoE activity)
MYKTQYGVDLINRFADKNREFVKVLGYSAIGVGFIGMLIICGFLIKGLYELIFVPSALPTMSLVIPGVQVPGSPVFVPFWYGIIALFIVILFHEFGHGIVARANGLKIKSTGLVLFGPLPGAFVEPDEKQLVKQSSVVQHSVFAAGPFMNGVLAIFVILILMLALNPLFSLMIVPNGVMFSDVMDGYPAAKYGVEEGVAYTYINDVVMSDHDALINELSCIKPNQTITLRSENSTVTLVTAANPADSSKGYLGVSGIKTNYEMKSSGLLFKTAYYLLYFLINLLEWVFMLSLGIGLANLLPLGPVDGGRMLGTALIDIKGKEKGSKLWARISILTLVIMAILIFIPIIKSLIFKI